MTKKQSLITSSTDDCCIGNTGSGWGSLYLADAALYIGRISAAALKFGCGLRFPLSIPKYSDILESYMIITPPADSSNDDVKSKITGELANAATFSTKSNYQSRRGTEVGGSDDTQRTIAQVSWTIPHFTADTEVNTPSLNTILQEIVDTNALTYIGMFLDDHLGESTAVDGTNRSIYSVNGSSTKCAKIFVSYTPYYKIFPSIAIPKGIMIR